MDRPLAVVFPHLFLCASDRHEKVSQYISRAGDHLQWGPIFGRNLIDEEESQFLALLKILSQAAIPDVEGDSRVWRALQDGVFLVSSFVSVIVSSSPFPSFVSKIWKMKAPPRDIAFRMDCHAWRNSHDG